jgi:hypothetical protein
MVVPSTPVHQLYKRVRCTVAVERDYCMLLSPVSLVPLWERPARIHQWQTAEALAVCGVRRALGRSRQHPGTSRVHIDHDLFTLWHNISRVRHLKNTSRFRTLWYHVWTFVSFHFHFSLLKFVLNIFSDYFRVWFLRFCISWSESHFWEKRFWEYYGYHFPPQRFSTKASFLSVRHSSDR